MIVFVFVALAASATSAAARDSSPRASLLDVPYLSQTQQLCGGAAVAMVLRYWGEHNVLPQDFASLVEPSENGIRTSVLTDAVTRRGWQAVPASIDATASTAWLASEIGKGHPIIALIEVSPRTYHYVVVVGVTVNEVVYHDPARAPFRIVPIREFEQQWAAANRWTLVVLPAANRTLVADVRPAVPAEVAPPAAGTTPCSALVAHSVTLARSGQIDEAERGLLTAQTLCPSGSGAGLELGGVRFLQRRYEEAETLAETALEASPRDETAWELLATSRYLQGDLLGALEAWNQIGRPRTDVVRIEGVERIDHPVIVRRTGLEPRTPITPSDFARAERRLDDLPTIKGVALNYFPRADGSADVRAVLSERSVLPHGAIGWAAVGVNTAFRKELRMPISGLFRQGERLDFRYRWRPNRPRVLIGLDAPAPGWLPGILGIEGLWERQTYPPFVAAGPRGATESGRVPQRLADTSCSLDGRRRRGSSSRGKGSSRLTGSSTRVGSTITLRRSCLPATGHRRARPARRVATRASRAATHKSRGEARGMLRPSGWHARASPLSASQRRWRCGRRPAPARAVGPCFARMNCTATASW